MTRPSGAFSKTQVFITMDLACWRAAVSCAAHALVEECTHALRIVSKERIPIVFAVSRARQDGTELMPMGTLGSFQPTESWKTEWLNSVNATAAELGRLIAATNVTADPTANTINGVAVAVARLLAVLAAAHVPAPDYME